MANDGNWIKVRFLVDSGADCTVLSGDVLKTLRLAPSQKPNQLIGVGGTVNTVVVSTKIRFTNNLGHKATFEGQFSGFTDPAALDMSVLGRDLLNLFAVIIDRLGDTVCLLWQGHGYSIETRG